MSQPTQEHRSIAAMQTAGYQVNLEQGTVTTPRGRLLSPVKMKTGYYAVTIFVPGVRSKGRSVHVHKIIAYTVFGDKAFEKGVDVRHKDNDKSNNTKNNLALGSRKDNNWDKTELARKAPGVLLSARQQGKPNVNRLLSDSQVLLIYRLGQRRRRGLISRLARRYKVSHSTVSEIISGIRYPTVTQPLHKS